jgi:hypothetical protein
MTASERAPAAPEAALVDIQTKKVENNRDEN